MSIDMLFHVFIILCVVGLILWGISKIPLPAPFDFVRIVLYVIVGVIVLLWIANSFHLGNTRIG